MTFFQEPPYTNGLMELDFEQIELIKGRLEVIKDSFVPTYESLECNTFYLVSEYNKQFPDFVINGDTAESILNI